MVPLHMYHINACTKMTSIDQPGAAVAYNRTALVAAPSYVEKREYLTYDNNDFLADIGGYLGLLLGHSILTLCEWLVLWAGRLTRASCGRN